MKVKTVQRLNTARGDIQPGTIIDLPGDLFEKLKGKVEPIPFRGAVEIVLADGFVFWLATEPESIPLIPEGMQILQNPFLPLELTHKYARGS